MGGNRDQVGLHDAVDRLKIALRKQQALYAYRTDEQPVLQYITGIDCFLVNACAADAQDCVTYGHPGRQLDIFRGHHGTGRVLRVLQDLVDLFAHFRVSLGQDTLHYVRGHLFNNINCVVDVQLLHDLTQLLVADALDQRFLFFALHFNEAFRGQFLRQKPEQKRQFFLLNAGKNRSNIRGIHRDKDVPDCRVFFVVQKCL